MKHDNTYVLNGTEGFLLDSRLDFLSEVKPLEECNGIGFYTIDMLKESKLLELIDPSMISLTEEDSYCDGVNSREIVIDYCTAMENPEKLTLGWWGKKWSECDSYKRELLTDTTQSHDWKSKRTSFINCCRDYKAEARKEWNSIVDQYKDYNHYALDEPDFDELWDSI